MRPILNTIVVIFALSIASTALAKPNLVGKWTAVAREMKGKREPRPADLQMLVEFVKGGKFISTAARGKESKSREGTWKVEGNKLTTVLKGKAETVTFEIKGNKLTLTQVARPDVRLYLERAR
jgi:uncharacterized protein (TIGR03066 family)